MKLQRLFALVALCLAFPAIALAAEPPAPAATAPSPAFHLDVNEAIGQIGTGMDEALTKLGNLAVEYGTKAIELAAAVVQAQSIANLIVGFVYLIVGLVAIAWARKPIPTDLDWCMPNLSNLGVICRTLIGWGSGIWLVLASGELLLNIWNWIGAIAPKLLLAKLIFDKVAG